MFMQKRVFIIHGWDGSPHGCWIPWLKEQLIAKGFGVFALSMPNPEAPEIQSWISHIHNAVGEVDSSTYFVGHSIGCQAILRYIAQLPVNKSVGGIVCVAGFFRLLYLQTKEEKVIAQPWLDTKIDCEKVRRHTPNIIAIFSDNDPDVDLGNKELFERNLNATTFIEHNRGHFSDDAGIKELPSVLESVLKISQKRS